MAKYKSKKKKIRGQYVKRVAFGRINPGNQQLNTNGGACGYIAFRPFQMPARNDLNLKCTNVNNYVIDLEIGAVHFANVNNQQLPFIILGLKLNPAIGANPANMTAFLQNYINMPFDQANLEYIWNDDPSQLFLKTVLVSSNQQVCNAWRQVKIDMTGYSIALQNEEFYIVVIGKGVGVDTPGFMAQCTFYGHIDE